ncbi:hypothetical protein BJ875DRAFT_62867 [Amylocarpus encephaloides]|uniref:C2H2-type domain-containing protein n=1 Tax=Amylocarpus encephaloides TaxID=45428 RepID=A0A9P7YH61_9HELO|nr:hypothetical protein BJ875DRAFT_62867 [Amylocarpus encephaloides]
MADDSPPGSPLSTISSDALEADYGSVATQMPPAKRQKIEDASMRATPTSHQIDFDAIDESSDTDGEVPNSPSNLRPDDDDNHEQVTICAWDGCEAGDLENMDKLVEHIHNEHIETRQKKYTCEWMDCNRKSLAHASGYALKAHMRSHTREKPFYCALPECDRAFTRSDALAKHMRTVHETEALRPSDPIPKSMQPAKTSRRLKLTLKNSHSLSEEPQPGPTNGTTNGDVPLKWTSSYHLELGFTPEEEAKGPEELYRHLRRELIWAEAEAEMLKRQAEEMEQIRKNEWLEKEVLLGQVIKNEISYHERRREILAGAAKIPTAEEIRAAAAVAAMGGAMSPNPPPSMTAPIEDQTEAATVLASLRQTS